MRNQHEFKFGLYLWRERSIERKITKILYHFICHKFPQKHSEGKTTDHNQSYSKFTAADQKRMTSFYKTSFVRGGGGGGGGAEVSCPNYYFFILRKSSGFCPNITWYFSRKWLFKNFKGASWAVHLHVHAAADKHQTVTIIPNFPPEF